MGVICGCAKVVCAYCGGDVQAGPSANSLTVVSRALTAASAEIERLRQDVAEASFLLGAATPTAPAHVHDAIRSFIGRAGR